MTTKQTDPYRWFITGEPIVPVKDGSALLVEESVQEVKDEPACMDTRFGQLATDLCTEIPGQGVVHTYDRARRVRQATYAIGYYLVGQHALPRMNAWLNEQSGLSVPSDYQYDPYEYSLYGPPEQPDPELFANSLNAAYWLISSAESVLNELEDETHPFHRLLHHISEAFENYKLAETNRNAERPLDSLNLPGRKDSSDPKYQHLPEYTYLDDFISPLSTNVGVGVDTMVAKAIHMIIWKSRTLSASDLAEDAELNFSFIRWQSRANRHTGSRDAKRDGLRESLITEGIGRLIAQCLVECDSIEELWSFISGYRAMRDESFCPAERLRQAPVLQSGLCHGSVNTIIRDRDQAMWQQQRVFAHTLRLKDEFLPRIFNMSTLALAIGKTQAETIYYPAILKWIDHL